LEKQNWKEFLVVPPQNYCPLNPKHSNKKESVFPSNHLFNVFQGVEVFALKLFVDNLICC
jgi:hypothetical protein